MTHFKIKFSEDYEKILKKCEECQLWNPEPEYCFFMCNNFCGSFSNYTGNCIKVQKPCDERLPCCNKETIMISMYPKMSQAYRNHLTAVAYLISSKMNYRALVKRYLEAMSDTDSFKIKLKYIGLMDGKTCSCTTHGEKGQANIVPYLWCVIIADSSRASPCARITPTREELQMSFQCHLIYHNKPKESSVCSSAAQPNVEDRQDVIGA